jgi:hypothetical protein
MTEQTDAAGAADEEAPIVGQDDISVSWIVPFVVGLLGLVAARVAELGSAGTIAAIGLPLAWHALDRRTRRFSLRIDGDAIVLRSRVFGVWTVRTVRRSLADDVALVLVRDEWDWPGLQFVTPPYVDWADHPPYVRFGSVRDAAQARAARDVDRHLDPALGDLAAWWPALDPASLTHNAWGRVASARTKAPFEDAELGTIPAGSTLRFCPDERFRVRATPDLLTEIGFAAPSEALHALAGLDGPPVPSRAGARVRRWAYRFDVKQPPRRHLHVVDAFDAASIEGRALVGTAPMEWVDGEVTRCTLAEPITVAGVALPAGCVLHAGGLELVVTSPAAYVHEGRAIAPPVHLHVSLPKGSPHVSLRAILRRPELAGPTVSYAHPAPRAPHG